VRKSTPLTDSIPARSWGGEDIAEIKRNTTEIVRKVQRIQII